MKFIRNAIATLLAIALLLTGGGLAGELKLPAKLTTISANAFYGDTSLDKVTLPDGIKTIGSQAFMDSTLTRINLPDSLTSIGDNAFDNPGQVRVTANSGSYAWQWAVSHGYLTDPSSYPESTHPYANSLDHEWTFTLPASVAYLVVTFSDDTEFESKYDTLTITDAEGSTAYSGKELSGRTLCIVGNQFKLRLRSDKTVNNYGFRITDIQPRSSTPVLGLTIKPSQVVMRAGNTLTMTPVFDPVNVDNQKVSWSSSDGSVAKVSSDGVVTAFANGKTTITATSAADKSIYGTCEITVANNVSFALLIGEMHYSSGNKDLLFTEKDVEMMDSILQSRHASNGNTWFITRRYDRTASQVHEDIQTALGSATASDVSLFFISSHGYTKLAETSPNASALVCSDGSLIKTSELASWLSAIKGKVIVIIDACGSGGFIYAKGADSAVNVEQFNQDIVDAFMAADTGVYAETSDGMLSKVGELRKENKFYVLTASAFQQSSWGDSTGSFFTRLVRDGIGTSGSMPADITHAGNANDQLTLHELYKYISDLGDNHQLSSGMTQQVQVYPEESGFVLFKP